MTRRWCNGLFAISLLAAGACVQAQVLSVDGETFHGEGVAKAAETWRSPALASEPAAELRFLRLDNTRIENVKRSNAQLESRRFQIGIARHVASETEFSQLSALNWRPVAGGVVAAFDVVAPDAPAMRVAIRADRLPDGVELRVAGSDLPGAIYATDAAKARELVDGSGWFWTAATDGERQRIELFAPDGVDVAGIVSPVSAISEFLAPASGDLDLALKNLGSSGSCNINAVCRDASLGQGYVNTKNAVAWMNFMSGGDGYMCTGTLLNDTDTGTQIPWFYTAHHCIRTQTEANTLSTFWKRESATCPNPGSLGPNAQVTGGAQMLYSQASTDGALLRLNNPPPAGVGLAGWNAGALSVNTGAIAIHHPMGDNKKYSRGTYLGTAQNENIDGQVVSSALRVSWQEGTTEGGSSGSGLFVLGSNGYQLRGGLWGGGAHCNNVGLPESSGNRDLFSRLELVFPSISQYLAPASGSFGPTRNYTGQWHNEAESGRGLSLFQFGDTLFGLWFVYDSQGRASWYQIENVWTANDVTSGNVGRWTGSPWNQAYNPNARVVSIIGTYKLTFTSATQATLNYNVDGVNRTIPLVKIQ